jgi:type IV pilus assembly protein PilB
MQTNNFADYLIAENLLTAIAAKEIIAEAEVLASSFIAHLIKIKFLPYRVLAENIANYFKLPFLNLNETNIVNLPTTILDNKLITKHQVLPIKQTADQLHVAITDPTATNVLNEIKFHANNMTIKPIIVEHDKLTNLIQLLFNKDVQQLSGNEDRQVIEMMNRIITDGINRSSSDIHLEPLIDSYRIRFRIDGILHEIFSIEASFSNRLITRLKIMANLDIAEKRLPQDGRFSISLEKNTFDCRINVCPTTFGERVVIRILNPNQSFLQIDDLGFENFQADLFCKNLNRPQGLILVTGPTGSGKTISLYAALKELNHISKNIVTIEDPIEINLPGISQVTINPKINLDFARTLKAFLRQDPDIIMIGEIRDMETAEIAIKAAHTGHLVLTTLHTNTAAEAITRLLNMGIPSFNLANSLIMIIAQRLVRKLCPLCKIKQGLPKDILLENGFREDEIDSLHIFKPCGCNNCNNGYKGRIGIFEILNITENINQLFTKHHAATEIFKQATQEGMVNLRRAALNKVKAGITSIEEINRVT